MNRVTSSQPIQTQLALDFVIVGGGLTGLTCAVALRRVGHRVLVLEQDDGSDQNQVSGGVRGAPNLSKILFRWGYEKELRAISVVSEQIFCSLYETGEFLGTHRWDEEMLKETGGTFVLSHYADLLRLLKNIAISLGARIRHKTKVVSYDPAHSSVKLQSGEMIRGDVIIAADGPGSLARQHIRREQGFDGVDGTPSGVTVFNALIPGERMRKDPDLAHLFNQTYTNIYVWFGNGTNIIAYRVGGRPDFAVVLTTALDPEPEGTWSRPVAKERFSEIMTKIPCEPRLRKLAEIASTVTRVSIKQYEELEDWTDETGHLVLLGDAASPVTYCSIQSGAMAVEDGAVLARLFAHLSRKDQIQSFLWAFQELRQRRRVSVSAAEVSNFYFMALPPGEHQETRDKAMRQRNVEGKNLLDTGDGGTGDQWEQNKEMFGYETEDEADNWWVEWGILRERAKATGSEATMMPIQFSSQRQSRFAANNMSRLYSTVAG